MNAVAGGGRQRILSLAVKDKAQARKALRYAADLFRGAR